MDTPLEESNLAFIGSDEDQAAREAAAALEVHWEGAGEVPGTQIWRVENRRTEDDVAVFGINPWPVERHGEFYTGDSYIVLQTTKDNDKLVWDIYFWIGGESTQDEYGVVSYKANELDKLLGDAPIQHREIEGNESIEFTNIFKGNIRILDGGIESGFRHVEADEGDEVQVPMRLFQIHRSKHVTRSFQVPLKCSSLNDGDAFLLDAGNTIYTWFGTQSSPFEKERTAQMAHNLAESRHGHCRVEVDVDDDNEEFWSLLGGRGEIQASSPTEAEEPVEFETKMYVLSDYGGGIKVNEVPADKSNLVSDDVCIIDGGNKVFVWVGKGATDREHDVSMMIVEKQLKIMGRTKTTEVTRVLEGQEGRCRGFDSVLM